MNRLLTAVVPMVTTLASFSAACESSGPSDSEVLINIADDIAVPAFQAVAQEMAQLNQTVEALCTLPNGSTLEAARQSWRDARASWMASEALWFGPVIDRRSQSLLDWSPTDVNGVEHLTQSTPLTVEEVSQSLASNQRGFGAIEYGLFHGDVLAALAGSQSRCSSLMVLTFVAQEEAAAILAEWVEGADRSAPYQSYFTSRSNPGLLESAAVADMVRTQVFLVRDIVDIRLASALGLRDEAADLSTIPGNASTTASRTCGTRYKVCRLHTKVPGRMLSASRRWCARFPRTLTSGCATNSPPPSLPSNPSTARCELP